MFSEYDKSNAYGWNQNGCESCLLEDTRVLRWFRHLEIKDGRRFLKDWVKAEVSETSYVCINGAKKALNDAVTSVEDARKRTQCASF